MCLVRLAWWVGWCGRSCLVGVNIGWAGECGQSRCGWRGHWVGWRIVLAGAVGEHERVVVVGGRVVWLWSGGGCVAVVGGRVVWLCSAGGWCGCGRRAGVVVSHT